MIKIVGVHALLVGAAFLSACGSDGQQPLANQMGVTNHTITDRLPAPPNSASSEVCVSMTGSDGQVGGLQLDLTWDAACMTAVYAAGAAAKCTANPASGKSVQTRVSWATLRALFLSLSDTAPVPDGELFCCDFMRSGAGSCCALSIANLILAGPTGGRVYDPSIAVQIAADGTLCGGSGPIAPIPSAPGQPPA